jgi:hypothetical protein
VLDTVFSYVGTGEYLYAGAVCRGWRGRYIKLCYNTKTRLTHKLCTTYKSAFMTAARLQLALDSKLEVDDLQSKRYDLALWVTKLSLEPCGVLALARVYGLNWSKFFTIRAVRTNRLDLLQWLHKCRCPTDFTDAIRAAIYFDHVDILAWIYSIEVVSWNHALTQRSFEQAGRDGSVAVVKWLRSQGARWPETFVTVDTTPDRYYGNKYWMVSTVKWALANGCTWGDWRCQELARECVHGTGGSSTGGLHINTNEKNCYWTVSELFAWAHGNGCPCTCHDPEAEAPAPPAPQGPMMAFGVGPFGVGAQLFGLGA